MTSEKRTEVLKPGPSKGCPMDYPTLPIGFHWAPLRGSWRICLVFVFVVQVCSSHVCRVPCLVVWRVSCPGSSFRSSLPHPPYTPDWTLKTDSGPDRVAAGEANWKLGHTPRARTLRDRGVYKYSLLEVSRGVQKPPAVGGCW